MTYDADLNLIVCEHATSFLIRETPDGAREVLASHFEGKELNSPNDVCVRSDGSIYFTDPWYGRMPGFGVERPRELGLQGVYRLAHGGDLHLVGPIAICSSSRTGFASRPTRSCSTSTTARRKLIRVFNVAPDGSLVGGSVSSQARSGRRRRKRRSRRDEMRRAGQCLGAPVRAASGSTRPSAELIGKIAYPRSRGKSRLGRRRIAHAVSDRDALGLSP